MGFRPFNLSKYQLNGVRFHLRAVIDLAQIKSVPLDDPAAGDAAVIAKKVQPQIESAKSG